jgi:hypothetical protein
MKRRKSFLKEVSILLIAITMVLSTIVVTSGIVIFSQPPDYVMDLGYYSDVGWGAPYRAYDNFEGLTQDITDVHWWGVFDYGNHLPTLGDQFEIAFCPDDFGIPDYNNPIAVFIGSIGAEISYTGTGFDHYGSEVYKLEMDLPTHISMSSGWVSFFKITDNDQKFAIFVAPFGIGNGICYIKDGDPPVRLDDLAFELTTTESEPSVYVDIKPGSCPNPLNTKSKGVLPVAILGTAQTASIDDTLCTIFASNNQYDGNMFDVKALNDITITSFDVNIDESSQVMEVWYRPDSYVGHETSSDGWTLLGTAFITGLGLDVPTPLPIGGLSIPAGQTYGIYVTSLSEGIIRYTNADGTNQFYSNSDMEITLGTGGAYFSVTLERVWNGCIHYSRTDGFDVMDIDPATILLAGVPPIRYGYEDVATPFTGDLCDCHELSGDGILDMTLKFDMQEIASAIGIYDHGDYIPLTLTGSLLSGEPFSGQDCVMFIYKTRNIL